MAINCLLLQFNNYFNKKVKYYETVDDYISHASKAEYSATQKGGVADLTCWNPNDGIETVINVRWHGKWNPDYLLIIENGQINSRWFIKEPKFLSKGNYDFTLRRDVVADRYEHVLTAPCFIEKGFVSDINPLIFNKEDFSCNQIKVSETKLHDHTYISWIIAYYNLSEKSHLEGDVTTTELPYINLGVADISSWGLVQKYNQDGYNMPHNQRFSIDIDMAGTPDELRVKFDHYNEYSSKENYESLDTELEYDSGTIWAWEREERTVDQTVSCINSNKTSIQNRLNNYAKEADSFETVVFYNNKIVKTNDGKFYRISVKPAGSITIKKFLDVSGNATTNGENELVAAIESAFKIGGVFKTGWSGNFTKAIYVEYTVNKYDFSYKEITNSIQSYHYDFKNVKDIVDAPYGIIAFPFKAVYDYTKIAVDNNSNIIVNDLAIEIIRDMTKDGIGGSNKIFDVQILPFCPITRLMPLMTGTRVRFNLTNDLSANEYTIIKDTSDNLGTFALHPTTSKFTLNIPKEISVQNVKFENQCEFYRLCSPNWASCFEFNLARNGGLNYFNVDCTYKPYQPYIHINPDFNLLYGQDFNDARGLIFSGDFSISSISSAFESYALNNKNYQEMFNRQIESMDTNYDIQQRYRTYAAAAGVIGSGGAAIGGLAMGHPAAALGGVVGIASSAYSGFAGFAERKEKHEEERDYAIDMHNFNLQNIKAKPDTLTKVSAYNNNNKIFPVLEKYSCTNEEKAIFIDKIKYEGMTVNAIGKIEDYLKLDDETFIKGRILRFENLNEDDHFAQEIYNEVARGLYFERGE